MKRSGDSLANCTVFFGIRDQATAEEMSKRLGQTTVHNHSGGETHGSSGPSVFSGGGGQSTVNSSTNNNWSEVGRALVMADELTRESERTVFVLQSGHDPIRVTQARYYEDPEMAAAVARAAEPTVAATPSLPTPTVFSLPASSDDVGPMDWASVASADPTMLPAPTPIRPEEKRIRFACPCGKRFSLAPAMAGKKAKCTNPKCTRSFVIPGKGNRSNPRMA